jgi:magnesium transporter
MLDKPKIHQIYRVARDSKPGEDKPVDGPDVIPRHWFCVTANNAGEITKTAANSVGGLYDLAKSSKFAWIDYWASDFDKDSRTAAAQFGFTDILLSSLIGENSSTYQDFDTEMGLRVPSIFVENSEVKSEPFLILLRENFILSLHPLSVDRRFARLRRYSDTVFKRLTADIPRADKQTLLMIRLIDENNDRNFDELRKIEGHGDSLASDLMDPKTPRDKLGPEIYRMKHALITYLDALWETIDVLHALRYGDAQIITDDSKLLDKIGVLAEDVNRQIALSEHMSEVLASGLEVLQSIYNNQLQALNNRLALVMTYLTILGTAVLVPNTLATIFSSSAFAMEPKDIGWYVTMLVGSTILATGGAYWWIKKMGWLPKKPD